MTTLDSEDLMPSVKAIDAFKSSSAWSKAHNLPCVPRANNPWIYTAYAEKIIRLADSFQPLIADSLKAFFNGCRNNESGLMNRWPDGNGGVFSYDEFIGASALSKTFAKILYFDLIACDFVYNNKPDTELSNIPDRFNTERFIFFTPYMRAACGLPLSYFSQLKWSLHLIINIVSKAATIKARASGLLKTWVMIDAMNKPSEYPFAALVIALWRWRMRRAGVGPRFCFGYYLTEEPVFQAYAPEAF